MCVRYRGYTYTGILICRWLEQHIKNEQQEVTANLSSVREYQAIGSFEAQKSFVLPRKDEWLTPILMHIRPYKCAVMPVDMHFHTFQSTIQGFENPTRGRFLRLARLIGPRWSLCVFVPTVGAYYIRTLKWLKLRKIHLRLTHLLVVTPLLSSFGGLRTLLLVSKMVFYNSQRPDLCSSWNNP